MSASEPRRVALLARPGAAREQLRAALKEAGARIVLEDDPTDLQAYTLSGAMPQVVLIALEPAIEEALVRFEPVLEDPAITVIYDEADLAAKRQGWDAQRWARHLSAKLFGHDDVLPPGHEKEPAIALEPGLPPTPAQMHAHDDMEKHLQEAVDIAWELPQDDFAFTPPSTPAMPVVDADDWLRASTPPVASEPAPPPLPSRAMPPPLPGAAAREADKFELSLEPLDQTVVKGPRAAGAVIAFAGIGGPDAVRKLLAGLTPDFPRPLIVHLKLDGGRYDNLVRQMARASTMPVELAEAGKPALAGHVYVLPGDVSLDLAQGVVNFRAGDDLAGAVARLPARDSSVLLLSGADAHWVDVVWPLAAQGAWIVGQSPEGCYDPSASHALLMRGGPVASPNEIAQRLIEQWA